MTTLSPCRGVGLKANVHQNTQIEPDVSFKLHPAEAKLIKNRVTEEDPYTPRPAFSHTQFKTHRGVRLKDPK